jgi:hypothetical protein
MKTQGDWSEYLGYLDGTGEKEIAGGQLKSRVV